MVFLSQYNYIDEVGIIIFNVYIVISLSAV